MRRFFNILLGALAMIAVALLSAFLAMRLAIHGREVEVPNVAGMTVAEANSLATSLGLNMNLENHFYSTVTPAGRVLSQYPAAGTKVRREWVMRVTESIGPQRVSVPNVVGQTEREASVTIRRLALDLGTVAYIPAPGPSGIVLSQTPTPDAAGVDGPRISLLVSEPLPVGRPRQIVTDSGSSESSDTAAGPATGQAAATAQNGSTGTAPDATSIGTAAAISAPTTTSGAPTAATAPPDAYVMPNLIGLTLATASSRVAAMGLHISSMEVVPSHIKSIAPIAAPSAPGSSGLAMPRPMAPVAPITMSNTVIAQSPLAGHRVTKADAIRITLSR